MSGSLHGKVALVTGAGHGLGRAIAVRLAAAGADLVVSDIDADAAGATAAMLAGGAGRCLVRETDVGEVDDIRSLVADVEHSFGPIEVLVNNAGITKTTDLFDIDPDEWDRINRINARGLFFCLQAVAARMVTRRSGRIINIASIAGKGYPRTANIAYAASKGAVLAITQVAAQWLAAHNVNVNAICPGPTMTEMLQRISDVRAARAQSSREELERQLSRSIPLGRINDAEDIAAAALFLATDESRNITGQALNVDGGLIWH